LESLALPFENYQLAYTPSLVAHIFSNKVNEDLMLEGKFTHGAGDSNWWIRSGTTQFIDAAEAVADAKNRFYVPVSYTDPYGAKTKVSYYGDYFLFIEETEDALGNKHKVELFNFRTLAPKRMQDANGNFSEVMVDELGLVKAMAIFGKGNEADNLLGLNAFSSAPETGLVDDFFNAPASDVLVTKGKSLLQRATARFAYDFDVYKNSGKPVVVAAIVREQHFQDNNDSPIQLSFEYSNGLGQVVMRKSQAEPGSAKQVAVKADDSYTVSEIDTSLLSPKQLRWLGNGRAVLNNKGNAVKQFEPYFSVSHRYEDLKELVETGVTPLLYYDAIGRLIKTELPDGTLSRTEFDSWQQAAYDPNDTVLESIWYHKRSNRLIDAELIAACKDPEREKAAADQTAKHAGTPAIQHFDTLGRPVLSIEHNKHLTADEDEFYLTKVRLDSEGNLRSVTDARGNVVMRYQYDMLGNKVYQQSMDAGQRWLLTNILGNPLRTWDERDHEFRYFYDSLHRPIQSQVIGGDGDTPLNHIVERIFYGEAEANPELKNLRGQAVRHYDTGGLVETPEYDFKGQPATTARKLFKNYKGVADWTDDNLINDLEPDSFTFITKTDALGRIARQTAPDGSIVTPSYNEAGLLKAETVKHPHLASPTPYIKDIDYNEKGQRNKIIYGNDVVSRFYYDKETFRLTRLETKRQNSDPLQDWHYTFDPLGNITHIEDKNIPTVFFNNQKIIGVATYSYDALYRLVEAKGRENASPLLFDGKDNWNDAAFMKQLNPGDPLAMRQYTQSYRYDEVGNIQQMQHKADSNNWTRDYTYQAANNRLVSTQIGQTTYSYPHHAKHGYMTAMPHLEEMDWNFKEELVRTIRQKRSDGGTPETTYYQYDGQGQRIRKITENTANAGVTPGKKDERIYIAGFELYKQHSGSGAGLERTSLSLMDKQHRFVMIDTETKSKLIFGIPVGRTAPKQTQRYQLHNHLGSAALELDGAAQVISYEEYHPFGTTAYQAKNLKIKAAAKRYRYTGMERDEESGLEYHSARYYLPWLGRWLSCDPASQKDDASLFEYCNSNPLKMIDLNGKAGVEFRFKDNAVAIQEATKLMVERIAKELSTNFGIAVDVQEITKTETSFWSCSGTPGASPTTITLLGYKLALSSDQAKIDAAQKNWDAALEKRRLLTAKTVEPGTDASAISNTLIDRMNKLRTFVKDFFKESHTIDMKTGGDVKLGGFHTSSTRTSVEGNPFTWLTKDKGVWGNSQEFGAVGKAISKAQLELIWGPTLLLIHEMEHIVGKTIKGELLPGSAVAIYEEDMVMKDVDEFASAHPDIGIRGQYVVQPGQYTVTGETLGSKDQKIYSTAPTDKSWVKWATQQQLDTGIR